MPTITIAKSILVYLQIVPLFLLPLFIAQIFGRIDLLQNITIILANSLASYINLWCLSIIIALVGEIILKTKFL